MRLIQSIDNISWTIHEQDGVFKLTIWQGDGCDQVYASKNENLQWVNDVDPLDLAVPCDMDALEAGAIDTVAYWEASSYEILDDEIDWLARAGVPLASPVAAMLGYRFEMED